MLQKSCLGRKKRATDGRPYCRSFQRQRKMQDISSCIERVAKLRFTTRKQIRTLAPHAKKLRFSNSRIYRRKIRGTCPRIFRIFIEIGLRPKSLIDFCNNLNAGLFILHFRFCRFLYSFGKRFLIVAYLHGLGKIIALQKVTAVRGGKLKLFLGLNSLAKQFDI